MYDDRAVGSFEGGAAGARPAGGRPGICSQGPGTATEEEGARTGRSRSLLLLAGGTDRVCIFFVEVWRVDVAPHVRGSCWLLWPLSESPGWSLFENEDSPEAGEVVRDGRDEYDWAPDAGQD